MFNFFLCEQGCFFLPYVMYSLFSIFCMYLVYMSCIVLCISIIIIIIFYIIIKLQLQIHICTNNINKVKSRGSPKLKFLTLWGLGADT